MWQYFKLLLSDILPVWTQELQNQGNDIPATEIICSQSREECLLSFTSDLWEDRHHWEVFWTKNIYSTKEMGNNGVA